MVRQEDILDYFKTEFETSMQKFSDMRELNYSLDIINTDGLVDCNWSQQNIKIRFKIIPIDYYLSNPAHVKIFDDNPEAYRKYFIHVARHEYGHSISCESFNKLQSYILPIDEYAKCWIDKQYFKIHLNEIFFDFYANFQVYEKINKSIPEEHIKLNYNSFQTTFEAGYCIFGMIKTCLLHSQVFFIYNQWNKLNPVFIEFKVNNFLDFLYIINNLFKKVILKKVDNDSRDMDSIISDITDLAEILDDINWKQIVLENNCNTGSLVSLENFKKKF